MRLYHSRGESWLVCPRLLELDPRHGVHPHKWPKCRRAIAFDEKAKKWSSPKCWLAHEHEDPLVDPEGHRVCHFVWIPGCRPPTSEEHAAELQCDCGRLLVHADLDDLYDPKHLAPAAADLQPGDQA